MFGKKSEFDKNGLRKMANTARLLAVEAIQNANSGHPGIALGFADVITVLFAKHLEFDPSVGDWDGRDRLILSAGHGSALLYSVLHLAGYPITRDQLKTFRKIGGLPGHPERNPKIGVEMTTGPLGQGFASAVGIAMARPKNNVYVIASDGDLMEGVAQESASFAGFKKLSNLIVLWDNNGITIDGRAANSEDVPEKFRAMGWNTIELDGNDPDEIDKALSIAKKMTVPVLLACKTTIGLGSKNQGTELVHGNPLDYKDAMRIISVLTPDFEPGFKLWKKIAESKIIAEHKSEVFEKVKWFDSPTANDKDLATRSIFNTVIKNIVSKNPDLVVGGSADLSGSTGSFADAKNYVHYGIREHAMGAIMNGLAMCGLRPYGSTFLAFSDYMRGSIRMSALMGLPVLFVFSHDSIALGEDGPTHQPIEQLPALRLIPNLTVFRPCNLMEMFLCLKYHFEKNLPSAIILSRQNFSVVPESSSADVGGYIVSGDRNSEVKLIATGSEVALAMKVRDKLESKKIKTCVISVPSLELINKTEFSKIMAGGFTVWIEASAQIPPFTTSMIVRINNFGESGNGNDVYKKHGFDPDYISSQIVKKIKR
jgi:transketolase